ncbi:MAG: hypothetical protein ACRCXZ_04435 [Patescibacteria group bacterium]
MLIFNKLFNSRQKKIETCEQEVIKLREATANLKKARIEKQEETDKHRQATKEEIKLEQQQAWFLFNTLTGTLLISSIVYVSLHVGVPKKSTSNTDNTLVEIRTATKLIQAPIDLDRLQKMGEDLKTLETEENKADKELTLLESIGDGLINEADNRKKQIQKYSELIELAKKELQNTNSSSANNPLVIELEKLSKENGDNNIDSQQLQKYTPLLELAENEYIKSQDNNSFFWSTKPLLWIEIAFWAWVGTIFYLLSEIHTYYKEDDLNKQNFIKMTPWYFITLFRGTFVVFIIMLCATTIQIGLGTSLSLGTAPIQLLVFASGVLGYYNRVAKEQLELIVKGVFNQAWKLANPNDSTNDQIPPSSLELKIEPALINLTHEQSQLFKAESDEEVTWTREPEIGTFNPTTGKETTFTAPTVQEANGETKITVIVTSPKDSSRKAEAMINLANLDIKNQPDASSSTQQPMTDVPNGVSDPALAVAGNHQDADDKKQN